ncbi:MAG: hypothetical protein PWR01_1953 [Clostridiales bacterium]|jgi:nucleotidyltransferase substrate binding protein (TIGR01987 family)|nr:hypothetical protein [Clostridiales bacterium]MDN5280880.1 hypothetical protein [Candidatus Ozemobacter sp.]
MLKVKLYEEQVKKDMSLELESLEKAVGSLIRAVDYASEQIAVSHDSTQKEVLRAGVIQNFEFTYELCWKFMKRWLEFNVGSTVVDGVPRRELFRIAAESILIEDVEKWMIFHEARNRTSHIYDPEISEEVYKIATSFVFDAKNLLKTLKSKNA